MSPSAAAANSGFGDFSGTTSNFSGNPVANKIVESLSAPSAPSIPSGPSVEGLRTVVPNVSSALTNFTPVMKTVSSVAAPIVAYTAADSLLNNNKIAMADRSPTELDIIQNRWIDQKAQQENLEKIDSFFENRNILDEKPFDERMNERDQDLLNKNPGAVALREDLPTAEENYRADLREQRAQREERVREGSEQRKAERRKRSAREARESAVTLHDKQRPITMMQGRTFKVPLVKNRFGKVTLDEKFTKARKEKELRKKIAREARESAVGFNNDMIKDNPYYYDERNIKDIEIPDDWADHTIRAINRGNTQGQHIGNHVYEYTHEGARTKYRNVGSNKKPGYAERILHNHRMDEMAKEDAKLASYGLPYAPENVNPNWGLKQHGNRWVPDQDKAAEERMKIDNYFKSKNNHIKYVHTGYGYAGGRRARFRKGSPEAKAYMAALRRRRLGHGYSGGAMRGYGVGGMWPGTKLKDLKAAIKEAEDNNSDQVSVQNKDGEWFMTQLKPAKNMVKRFERLAAQADKLKKMTREQAIKNYNDTYRKGKYMRPQWQVMTKPIRDRMINFIDTNHPTRKRFREVFTRGSKVSEDFGNKFIHFLAQDKDYNDKEAGWAKDIQAALSRADEWRKDENVALRKANAKNRNRVLAARRRKAFKLHGVKNLSALRNKVGNTNYLIMRNKMLKPITDEELNALNAIADRRKIKKMINAPDSPIALGVDPDDEDEQLIADDDSMTV